MLVAFGKNALIFDVGPIRDHFCVLLADHAEGIYGL